MLKMPVWSIFLVVFVGCFSKNDYLCIVVRIKEQREDVS